MSKQGVVVLNPPFDPRILTVGNWTGTGKLKRGWIVNDPTQNNAFPHQAETTTKARINFLYNPESVTVSHSMPSYMSLNQRTHNHLDKSRIVSSLGIGDVSIDLLFDRTYELWDSAYKGTMQGNLGVYADVLAFYEMVGLVSNNLSKTPSLNHTFAGKTGIPVTPSVIWSQIYPNNIATLTNVYLYIGDKLKYYGAINGLEIVYSHWTQKMVPARCEVTFDLQLQAPNKPALNNVGGAGSTPVTKPHDTNPNPISWPAPTYSQRAQQDINNLLNRK